MAENIIEPIEVLNEKGRAGVLFVLPWVRNVNDTCIDASQATQQFFKITSKVLPSWAAITLKKTSGQWGDEGLVERVQKGRARIDKAIKHYKPGIVVIMGVNFSKMLIPELRRSKQNLVSTFSTYTTLDGKEVPALVWGAPDKLIEDPLEHVRIPETLAKLYFFATRKHYEAKPVITNLDTYKASKEYIDFLTHEHDGYIGFDTETYNLNRIHHTRLGSMQFCTDAYNSYVMLWDSKHQAMSTRDLDRLRDPIKNLFGSRTTKFNAWIAHNGAFDIMQIKAEFKTRTYKPVLDTMLLTHLMDENRKFTARVSLPKAGPQALKTLVQEFMGFTHYSDEAMKARSDGTLMDLPLPDFLEYSGFDPIVTYRLFHVLKAWAKLEKYDKAVLNLLRNLHSRALKMYSDISENGFPIDKESVISLLDKSSIINKRIAEINEEYKAIPEVQKVNRELAEQKAESTMFLRVPYVFDINKQAHRSALFFHSKHGFQFPANEEGKYSAGKKFQKENAKNPCVALFAEAQGLVKLRDAYIKPIFESVFGPNAEKTDVCDGRVHSDFMLSRTVTGRVASRNPNCIVEGTQVLMANGQRMAIDAIQPDMFVVCMDDQQDLARRCVLNKWYNGRKHVLRLSFKGPDGNTSELLVTKDHKIRMRNGLWCEAQYLDVGDLVYALNLQDDDTQGYVVTGIERLARKRRVWDIEVDEYSNFFANNVNVHNCQQVPRSDSPVKKAIKSLFIPSPGKILIQADLSAAEVRVWGALSGDEQICRLSQEAMVLRKLVRENPNDKKMRKDAELKADFHKQTYGLCYNKPPAEVSKSERQDAKKLSFGLLYGMSLNGLCRELGKEPDLVQEIMNRFFGVYKTGSQWLTKMQDFALENGYVQTPLGRRRRIPQVFTGDRGLISEAKRFAVNAPIQATASDYAMLSTCILQDAIVEADVEDDVKILNCVHDSVVLEVTATPEWIEWTTKTIRRVFTKDVVKVLKRDFDFELLAPIDIDIEISQHIVHECVKCKTKRYPGEGNSCENAVKTGKKKEDGSDETVPCGCKEYKEHLTSAGWGYLMPLEENPQGIAKAMKGIRATIPKPKKSVVAKT